MIRLFTVVGVVLTVLAVSIVWSASRSPAEPFRAMGVPAHEVTALRPNDWQISS